MRKKTDNFQQTSKLLEHEFRLRPPKRFIYNC